MKSDSVQRVHIGVDVSKDKLDIYVPASKGCPSPKTEEVDNDVSGFRQLRNMARKCDAIVCVEPTGGYELELITFLHRFGVAVAYADALRVRQFAKAEGTLSKNDRIDAALISRFADKIGVRILENQEVETVELRRKTKFRQTLIDQRTTMKNRLATETDSGLKALMREEIRHLNKLIERLEEQCRETVAANPQKDALRKRFTEVWGVGDVTAISILAGLPEIGTLPDAKLYRLVGISPEEKQSGKKECSRKIWGGRKDVRNTFYMAAVASIIWNAKLSAYYRKKRGEGHSHKWAIVPTMRKLLSLLNRIARDPAFRPTPEPESTKEDACDGKNAKTE